MAYKVIILYQLYMPSYFLGTFTEYPNLNPRNVNPQLSDIFTVYTSRTYVKKKPDGNTNRARGVTNRKSLQAPFRRRLRPDRPLQ